MTARILLSATLVLAFSLGGCASAPRDPLPTYQQQLDQLRADCAARDGLLTSSGLAVTGRPQADYVCRITGPASRLNN